MLSQISKAKEDSFVIFPTREYFRLVEEGRTNTQSTPQTKPAK